MLKGFNGSYSRQQVCSVCGEIKCELIGSVNYWNIKSACLVKCSACNIIQLDPMLTNDETVIGCKALFNAQIHGVPLQQLIRNDIRNYRRGILFGLSLKQRGIIPSDVLELGPGTGFFSCGLKFVFSECKVTVLDVSSTIVDHNVRIHGFAGLVGVIDQYQPKLVNKFDLVIARDIFEHISNISEALNYIYDYLKKDDGFLHFITPNGYEDVWPHYLTFKRKQIPSELLINHVNYFDGNSLLKLLRCKGFIKRDYYTYKFKYWIKGKGWLHAKHLEAPVSSELRLADDIDDKRESLSEAKREIDRSFLLSGKVKWLTYIFCIWHHYPIIRLWPSWNIGHEIYGLFKKV